MKTLFYRIGYGMLFVVVNIRVMVDLLPNALGYLMILSALSELRKKERSFQLGMWVSVVLSIVSIPQFFKGYELNITNPVLSMNIYLVLNLLETVLQWVLLYSICEGIFKLAAMRGNGELASSIRFRGWFYFICSALYMIVLPFMLNVEVTGFILFGSLFSSVAFILIILVIRRAGRELEVSIDQNA